MKKALAFAVVALIAYMFLSATKSYGDYETVRYTVMPGDTLWSIAERHKTPDIEIRKYINLLYRENPGLTPDIMPGEGVEIVIWEE